MVTVMTGSASVRCSCPDALRDLKHPVHTARGIPKRKLAQLATFLYRLAIQENAQLGSDHSFAGAVERSNDAGRFAMRSSCRVH